MLRLDIDTEWAKATIIRCPDPVLSDDLSCLDQPIRNFFRSLDPWIEGVDDTDKCFLSYSIGVIAQGRCDLFVDRGRIGFRCQLNEEIAGIYGEERGEEIGVWNFMAMDRVAVPARAGVDANILALGRREASKYSTIRTSRFQYHDVLYEVKFEDSLIIEVDKGLQKVGTRPGVARILLGSETTYVSLLVLLSSR